METSQRKKGFLRVCREGEVKTARKQPKGQGAPRWKGHSGKDSLCAARKKPGLPGTGGDAGHQGASPGRRGEAENRSLKRQGNRSLTR